MKIIIEGPDGSGKTTYAQLLSKVTGLPIRHMSYPKTINDLETMKSLYLDMIASPESFILDRAWFSEIIYGPLMRDYSALTEEEIDELTALFLESKENSIVYCTGDLTTLWNNCMARGELYVIGFDLYSHIFLRYNQVFDNLKLHPQVTVKVIS